MIDENFANKHHEAKEKNSFWVKTIVMSFLYWWCLFTKFRSIIKLFKFLTRKTVDKYENDKMQTSLNEGSSNSFFLGQNNVTRSFNWQTQVNRSTMEQQQWVVISSWNIFLRICIFNGIFLRNCHSSLFNTS